MSSNPRTATFLFTDLENSTPLWENHPNLMQGLTARHDALMREAIEAHRGRVVKTTGDGFHAAFDAATDGVTAALAGQQAMIEESWPAETGPFNVRMGLHTGESRERQGDYYGPEVNRAARVMGVAHGGQILISEATAVLIRKALPTDVSLFDLGPHRLKGIAAAEQIFQLCHPALPTDFPPLKSLSVYKHNLPLQLTTFVGRGKELAEVQRLLKETRLLTLLGPGGTGKTRLMLEVAEDVVGEYANGVWLVELAPLNNPARIAGRVAAALTVQEQPGRALLDAIVDYVRHKELLLLLDNVEHLVREAAELAENLLTHCPKLKILVTGREALSIGGEIVLQIPSLSLPSRNGDINLEEIGASEAVQLFLARAHDIHPEFELNTVNTATIVEIVRRLDGIPLALELAAARTRMLSVEQIAERLNDRFRLLTGGHRTALPRQQTLQAMIDWSYSLLSEPERILFMRQAVFVGGWTLEAAEAVCSGNSIDQFDVLDLLTRLVEKSLVVAEEMAGEMRYRRLETIRQYSRGKFVETDEVETVRNRHLDFYMRFSEVAEEHLQRRERKVWTRRLEAEQDNLRAAMEWGMGRNPNSTLRIVGALRLFWNLRGYSTEGLSWTQQALERVDEFTLAAGEDGQIRQAAKAKALAGLAWAYTSQGYNEQARITAKQSAVLYRQSAPEDRRELALILTRLAQVSYFLGRRDEAEAYSKESIALARAAKAPFAEVFASSVQVQGTAILGGDLDQARSDAEEALRLARAEGLDYLSASIGHYLGLIAAQHKDAAEARRQFKMATAAFQEEDAPFNATLVKSDLAHLERHLGNHERALELYRETILAFRDFGQRGAVAHQLECFAFIAIAQNDYDYALRLLGAAEAGRELGGTPMTPDEQIEYQKQVEVVREQMAPELFTKTWAEGRALTMEQAIQFATEVDSSLQ